MLLQLIEEFLSRAVDTRTHGAHGDLQHPGNLIVGEFFKAVEDEGFAQSVGELVHHFEDDSARFVGDTLGFGSGRHFPRQLGQVLYFFAIDALIQTQAIPGTASPVAPAAPLGTDGAVSSMRRGLANMCEQSPELAMANRCGIEVSVLDSWSGEKKDNIDFGYVAGQRPWFDANLLPVPERWHRACSAAQWGEFVAACEILGD